MYLPMYILNISIGSIVYLLYAMIHFNSQCSYLVLVLTANISSTDTVSFQVRDTYLSCRCKKFPIRREFH